MARRVLLFFVLLGPVWLLAGCGLFERPQRPAWRGQAEKICLAEKRVNASEFVQPAAAINGPGICGLESPFKVTALNDGTVTLNATQTLGCPMIAAMESWLTDVVQPVAMARFGQNVVHVSSMGTFACRSIDNKWSAKLSEHAFGNAIDVGGFQLADGRKIVVAKAWSHGDAQEKAFLREVHAGACGMFTTVLGPGSDSYHSDHLHLDLAAHGQTSSGPRRVCKPVPSPQLLPHPPKMDDLPDPPDLDEEMDVAQATPLPPSRPLAIASLDVGLPAVPPQTARVVTDPARSGAAGSQIQVSSLKAPVQLAPSPKIVYAPARPITPSTPMPRAAVMMPAAKPKPAATRPVPFDLDDITATIRRR